MASIRTAAQGVLDEARDGIAWIALWKNGRGWNTMTFWPDYDDWTNGFKFEAYELDQLWRIVNIDHRAVMVNSYYCNLGDTETMDRDSLADALRWQYEMSGCLISEAIKPQEGGVNND